MISVQLIKAKSIDGLADEISATLSNQPYVEDVLALKIGEEQYVRSDDYFGSAEVEVRYWALMVIKYKGSE